MKYLKIYESIKEYTFEQWLKDYSKSDNTDQFHIFCNSTERNFENKITSLKGIEKYENLESFNCGRNLLKSLKGLENLISLRFLVCHENILESLEELKNLKNLEIITCTDNKITSLKGLENCNGLKELKITSNKIKSLKEIEDLPKLAYINCNDNPLEEIPSKKLMKKNLRYSYEHFLTYEFQKNFLEEHPERVKELEGFVFDDKIKKEYKDLIEFFGCKL